MMAQVEHIGPDHRPWMQARERPLSFYLQQRFLLCGAIRVLGMFQFIILLVVDIERRGLIGGCESFNFLLCLNSGSLCLHKWDLHLACKRHNVLGSVFELQETNGRLTLAAMAIPQPPRPLPPAAMEACSVV